MGYDRMQAMRFSSKKTATLPNSWNRFFNDLDATLATGTLFPPTTVFCTVVTTRNTKARRKFSRGPFFCYSNFVQFPLR